MDQTDNYFTVSPMSKRLEKLEPGQTYTGQINIANPANAKEDFHYHVSVAPYGVIGRDYQANLTTDTNYTMISKWITVDQPSGTIAPNHVQTINYTIKVPENAPAGGQYAAIIVSKDPEASNEKESGVAVKDVHEMASLIYADVNGETIHDGEIRENNVPYFVFNTPITVSALLTNRGNIHEPVTVFVKATDFFTGKVLAGLDDKGQEEYHTEFVMPESERYAERVINNDLPQLGVVRVEQTVYYNNQTSTVAHNVIICPIWFLFIVLAIIFLTIFIIVGLVLKNKKKKQALKAL